MRRGRRWKEEEEEERGIAEYAVSSVLLPAGWQRLNDLPNNKSSRRYDRTRHGPSLGTREPLTSPLRPKATTRFRFISLPRNDAMLQVAIRSAIFGDLCMCVCVCIFA